MEYEKLIYTNSKGEQVSFGINSEYYTNVSKDVTGLRELSYNIHTTSSMGQHGDTMVGLAFKTRDIDINGCINVQGKERAYELARNMLKVMNPELDATLMYVFGERRRVINAKCERSPVFKRDAVMQNFTIQLICPKPFWREEIETKKEVASWVGAFQFPLVIPHEEGIVFGYRQPSVIVSVYNRGDISTGMRVTFKANATVKEPVLLNMNTHEFIKLNATLNGGDTVTIETDYGNKGAELETGGKVSDYFRFIDVDSTFMQLETGDNVFRYDAASGLDALEVTIYYSPKYLGV